ncbi:MAG TPA: DUF5666 domain-containing protein [Candidatus Limnocylindria bacterium]
MRNLVQPAALLASAAALACGDGTGPSLPPQFSREISFAEFEQAVTQGTIRLEIELEDDLVASEVEIKQADELEEEEELESRVTAIETTAGGGSITLALGGLQVEFTAATKFEAENDNDLTLEEFVARVEAALAAGEEPGVEAERPAPDTPQDPDDATFVATELKLDDESEDDAEIELNVDDDNVAECSTLTVAPAGCLGVLRVLGLSIAIVDGVTELEAEDDGDEGEVDDVDFEGLVSAVDVEEGTLTLADGTLIRIVSDTELDDDSGDDKQLKSLAAVAEALAQGHQVEADGKGVVESTSPRVIVAIEIKLELEDDPDDAPVAS